MASDHEDDDGSDYEYDQGEGEGDDEEFEDEKQDDAEFDDTLDDPYDEDDHGGGEEDDEAEEDDDPEEGEDDNDVDMDPLSVIGVASGAGGGGAGGAGKDAGEFGMAKTGLKTVEFLGEPKSISMAPSTPSRAPPSATRIIGPPKTIRTPRTVRMYNGATIELAQQITGPPPPMPSLYAPQLDADDLPLDDIEAAENLMMPLQNSVAGGRAFAAVF